MAAEWLDVVYTTPVMEDNTLEPREGMQAASEEATEVLQMLFPVTELYRQTNSSPLLAYVAKHMSKGKVCIISNLAHMHLFIQLNHDVLLDWHYQCSQEGHINLWPPPTFKLQPINWIELFGM